MHIKKFRAASMTEALGLVKKEFGPDGVILSAVSIQNNRTLFGRGQSGVEVTAARDSEVSDAAGERTGIDIYERKQKMTAKPDRDPSVVRPFQRPYGAYQNTADAAYEKNHPVNPDIRSLFGVYRQMCDQGVRDGYAMDLVAGVYRRKPPGERMTQDGLKAFLVDVFAGSGISIQPISFKRGQGKIVSLIGPTGVGKTTTAAKIAAIAKYRKSRKEVALITIDNYRVGGAAQLEKYAEIIGLPFRFTATRKSLMQTLGEFKDMDLVLIDTPGISLNNTQQLEELRWMLAKIRSLETHLLLGATTKEEDLEEVIDKFGAFPDIRMILTKVDESRSYGNFFNLLVKTKIPLSYFTKGQSVPEDIETATLEKILDWVVNDQDAGRAWSKPPELLAMEMDRFRIRLTEASGEPLNAEAVDRVQVPQDIFSDFGHRRIAAML